MAGAKCLMVQGTASSVGKSVLVTALCRILRQDGYRVAPFKAQNMALNSFATPDGGEIGRAQAVQAEAAGIAPTVEMNPILLKPEADARSQVIVRGRPVDVLAARDYYRRKDALWAVVADSLAALRAAYEVVVIEGAGSPAEVNIKDGDIVNMRVARLAEAPVLLVGDIDRGGVFASLVGTLELLEPAERALVQGLVINKFRGDVSLLGSGLQFLEGRTGKPVLGVVPYFHNIRLADEDSVVLEERDGARERNSLRPAVDWVDRAENGAAWGEVGMAIDVAVIRLPHIANFDDFDPLEQEAGVTVRYVHTAADLGRPDLVILPGTKTTRADLHWLREGGLVNRIVALAEGGTPVLGICGGFQMLGAVLDDPRGVEGPAGAAPGLGLLPVATVFDPEKTTCQVRARVIAGIGLLAGLKGVEIGGYEIHMGRTSVIGGHEHRNGPDRPIGPAFRIVRRSGRPADASDGLLGQNGLVLGTYLHGLFDNAVLRRALLCHLAARKGHSLTFGRALPSREEQYDRLAGHVRAHLDMARVYRCMGI